MEKANTKGTFLLLLADALTLFLLLAGGLASFLPVSLWEVDTDLLLTWCGLFAAGSAALYTWRWGGWTALGLLGAEGLLIWRFWDELSFRAWMDGAHLRDGTVEFLLLAFALALFLGWVVVRARCWYVAALTVVTPLLPAIMEGVLPNWTALTALTSGWGTMLLSALYSRQDKTSLAKGTLLSLSGMGILLLTLNAALPQEGYDRPQWATDARDDLIATVAEHLQSSWEVPELLEGYVNLDGLEGLGTGAPNGSGYRTPVSAVVRTVDGAHVDLRSAGPRRYTDAVVLEVQGAIEGRNYLWGGSAATYTGESWEDVAHEACDTLRDTLNENLELGGTMEPLVFPTIMISPLPKPYETMTITHLYPNGTTAYFPYRLYSFLSRGVRLESFLTMGAGAAGESQAVKERQVQSYQVGYCPGGPYEGFIPLGGDAAVAESFYREFVYENYTAVPWQTQEALAPLLEEMLQAYVVEELEIPDQWQEALSAAYQAANVLSRAANYDLNTPAMESGEDFVAHFLEEGRGYCVHFATAGAMLLRMQGIPARYASGYVFQAGGDGAARVKDADAHAWVEIYLDGYGWHPVEMTPGYSGVSLAAGNGEESEQGGTPSMVQPEELDKPEVPEESEGPSEPEHTESPEENAHQPDVLTPSEAPEEKEPLDLTWLRKAALAALCLAAPFALYRLALRSRRRERELPDTNRSAIGAYRRYRRLVSWGAGEIETLEDLARKAKFSQHTLTTQERELVWQLAGEAAEALDGELPRWKRMVFRCLRPVWF